MRVLITGGAGYLGTQLAIELNRDPQIKEIIIYDNLSRENYNLFLHSGIQKGKITFIKGEMLDSRKLRKIIPAIDVVIHMATPHSSSPNEHHLHEQVNNWGTAELVYAVEENPVKQFILLSSTSVYGNTEEEAKIETLPQPTSSIAHSILRGEKHVQRLMDKLPTQIIRCGNLYGYGVSMSLNGVINRFMIEGCFQGRISIHGDGNQKRPFIHINKAVEIVTNLLNGTLDSGIYNMVEHNLSVMDIVEEVQKVNPDMEMVFTNHHLTLPSTIVTPDTRMLSLLKNDSITLEHELQDFGNLLSNGGR